MTETARYRLQFFRQWLGDTWIEDIPASGSLEHAKAVAQVSLETLAREKTGRGRPRVVRIVEEDTHTILAEFRLTQGGPVEIARPPATAGSPAPASAQLKLVDSPGSI